MSLRKKPPKRLIGYARVSTQQQDLARQLKALKRAGCVRIYSHTASGKTLAGRPELAAALDALDRGDELVIAEWDRATHVRARIPWTEGSRAASSMICYRGNPTQYRLTHLPVCEPDNFRPATNEWNRFEEDITAAKSAIKVALPKQPSKPNGKVKHTWKAGTTLQ
jgi:hypothetical protein